MIFSDKDIETLKNAIKPYMSEKRYKHTIGVLECSGKIARELLPHSASEVGCAALLHDIAKEIPTDVQIKRLTEEGFPLTGEDRETVGVIHSFYAPYLVSKDFPRYATPDILSAVARHTVGDEDMTVFDKIIFLSDYIEEGREYESPRLVREFFFSSFSLAESYEEKLRILDEACLRAICGAEEALNRMGRAVNSRMLKTKNSLMKKKLEN